MPVFVHANENKIDSLSHLISVHEKKKLELHLPSNTEYDTAKVKLLRKLSLEYENIDYNKSLDYLFQALQIAKELKVSKEASVDRKGNGWARGMSIIYGSIATVYSGLAKYPIAMQYYDSCITVSKVIDNKKFIALTYNNIAAMYGNINEYSLQYQYLKKALELYSEIKDLPGMGLAYQGMVTLKLGQKQYRESINIGLKAIDIFRPIEDSERLIIGYINLSTAYRNLQEYDTAGLYVDSSLQLSNALQNKVFLGMSFFEKGRLFENKKEYNSAYEAFLKSITFNKEINYIDRLREIYPYLIENRISAYLENKNKSILAEAEQFYNVSTELLDSSESAFYYFASDLLYHRYRIDSIKGDYKKALAAQSLYYQYRDSVNENEKLKQAETEEMKNDFERKETELKNLREKDQLIAEAKLSKQKYFSYFSIGGLLIVGGFSFFLVKKNREKNRANAELNKTLTELKEAQDQLIRSEKMAAFGTMASRMAHEILNPLNFVKNFSDELQEQCKELEECVDQNEKDKLKAEISQSAQMISKHSKRAEEILLSLQSHINKDSAHEFFENER